MNANINQLNNKLEKLIQNDQKYKLFMRFQDNSIKRLKKIIGYEDFIINYLISKNNDMWIDYLRDNKEMQQNFKNLGQSQKKIRSSFNGNFFNFNKKTRKKSYDEDDVKENSIKKKNKILFDAPKKFGVKRLKSSICDNKPTLRDKCNVIRAKTNPIKRLKINSSANSFDDKLLKICEKRNKINKIEISIRKKRRSLSIKQKEVIDKWKNKIKI